MSQNPAVSVILNDLAAGRIDAAEAGRRIDALPAAPAESADPAEPAAPVATPDLGVGAPTDTGPADSGPVDHDAWAAATDRPQFTSYPTDPFRADRDETDPSDPDPEDEPAEEPAEEPEPPQRTRRVTTGGVERVSVRAVGRRVRIVGETSVATLSADGPHVLRRNGSVLEVSSDGEIGASLDGFSILRAPRSLDDFRALGLGKELFLRVNPNIVIDVEVTGGTLHTERVPHLGKVRITAGGAKLLDVQEINDALVQAGSATVKGSIRTGRNRIRAESGSLNVQLADDSNVTVTSDAQLGKVSWAGGHDGLGDEVVMGNGSAKLEVGVVMGHAAVRVGSDRVSEQA